VLYFSVRWGIPLIPESANHQAQEILKQWHHADPVDAFELERNQKVKALQGTFNPFIECPSFVDQIDFSNYTWSLSNTDIMSLPSP
jgi:endonuclease I